MLRNLINQAIGRAARHSLGSIILVFYRERSKLSSLVVGFQGLEAGLVMPALRQNAVRASRFIFKLVLTYRFVVAILAWPR
jgi:hypothetical protein